MSGHRPRYCLICHGIRGGENIAPAELETNGARLLSKVDDTQVIVVKTADGLEDCAAAGRCLNSARSVIRLYYIGG